MPMRLLLFVNERQSVGRLFALKKPLSFDTAETAYKLELVHFQGSLFLLNRSTDRSESRSHGRFA